MELEHSVGIRIRAFRKQRGLTQERLAELVERTPDAISQIERGINLPNLETLKRLSVALEVPVSSLFVGLSKEQGTNQHRQRLLAELSARVADLSDCELEKLLDVVRSLWDNKRS